MENITIWGRSTSANVQKVLWACREMGIEYDRVEAGGAFGRVNEAAYRRMNPTGLVPTIVVAGSVVWESNTILRFLAARFSGESLYPRDLERRSMVERWMDWQLGTLSEPMRIVFQHVVRHIESNALEAARSHAQKLWLLLDQKLAELPYVDGHALSLADIAIGPLAHRWFCMDVERVATPSLRGWYERLQQHAGFKEHVCLPLS